MVKDRITLIGLTMGLVLYMVFTFEMRHEFPYFTTVLIVFSFSMMVFVAFMKQLSNVWYQRGFFTNAILALFLPFFEGMSFLFVTVIVFAILAFSQYAVYQLKSSDQSNDS
ncbi:hypothetical protein [Salipaludibacillus daqingensis]|uniref:hypothetical protein n=1 Tax=Salipaludibacillus daqingensis TaxID=3041001 RepID=UPI0024749A7C|nr:hypothetical protein [Salipaludibacillus daqingensis]